MMGSYARDKEPSDSIKIRNLFIKPILVSLEPVTVAEPSKACTVFARSEAGIVDSNPTQGTNV
jgi:hypothetical protein